MSPIKSAIEDCYQRNAGSATCNEVAPATGAINGQVTANMLLRAASGNLVASVGLTAGAVPIITVVPAAVEGFLAANEYTLTGTVTAVVGTNTITDWAEGGEACEVQGWC